MRVLHPNEYNNYITLINDCNCFYNLMTNDILIIALTKEDYKNQLKLNNVTPNEIILIMEGVYLRKKDKNKYLKIIGKIKKWKTEFLKNINNLYGAYEYEIINQEIYYSGVDQDNILNPLLKIIGKTQKDLTKTQKKEIKKITNNYYNYMIKNGV